MSEAERRTAVKHHSPRVMVLRDERSAWTATHYQITRDAVQRAMREHA